MAADPSERRILLQLHWQNRVEPHETEFVAQCEWRDADTFNEWCRELIERRGHEMPDGWVPMVCNEECDRFVLAAA